MSTLMSDAVGIALVVFAFSYGIVLRRANQKEVVPAWTRSEILTFIHVTVLVALLAFGISLFLRATLG